MIADPRRVLIDDINNEYGEYKVRSMRFEHIEAFMQDPKYEIRRLVPFRETNKGLVKMSTGEILERLEKVVSIYMGGCLIIEDPTKTFSKSVTEDLIGAICTNRHNSCDMIMHYQSVGRILPVLHENINLYRFHHQSDDVLKSKNKLQETTQIFKICQILVDKVYFDKSNPKNKYYSAYIDKDQGKIIGSFTKQQFEQAVDSYIKFNHNELRPWLQEKNEFGKPVYTYPQAVAQLRAYIMERYYADNYYSSDEREAIMMAAIGFKGTGKTRATMNMITEDYCPHPAWVNK